jgi:hypothetical protein
MLTRVVSGKFRMMRVGFCTGIHPRLREAEEGILPLGEENVLDERERIASAVTMFYLLKHLLASPFCKLKHNV